MSFFFRAMSSPANKEQFLKQFEQIVEGVKNNKSKVILSSITCVFIEQRNVLVHINSTLGEKDEFEVFGKGPNII